MFSQSSMSVTSVRFITIIWMGSCLNTRLKVYRCCLCGYESKDSFEFQLLYGQRVCYECIVKYSNSGDLKERILKKKVSQFG